VGRLVPPGPQDSRRRRALLPTWHDLSDRFPAIAEAVAGLPRRSLILDAELIAFGGDGQPDFHLLRRKRAAVVAFVFDILKGDGADLRSKPWKDRRVFLERLMGRNKSPLLQVPSLRRWPGAAQSGRRTGP
jgi:bifunctional non-homologous end joining protein LigD